MKNNVSNIYGGLLMDPLFDLFPAEILPESKAFRSLDMKTDVKEENGNYVMEVELPGVNKKDISVSYNEGYLTIEAKVEHGDDNKDKKGNYIHRERFSGAASRSYYVGEIDEKAINASYTDGVLNVSFPKEAQKQKELTHKIDVK